MRAKMIDPKTGEIVWASDAEPYGQNTYMATIYNDPYNGKLIGHVEWPVSDEWKKHKIDPKTGNCVVPDCYGFCEDDSNACDWNDENAVFYYNRDNIEYKELLNRWFGASIKGSLDIIKELHEENKIDVNEINEVDGNTALINACNHGWNLVIEYLIEQGADIDLKSKESGQTPLIAACYNTTDLSIVKYLIDKGADIQAEDKNGFTALSGACSYDSDIEKFEMVKFLISKGINVHTKSNKRGVTNLMLACLDDRFDTIKLLIQHGVDVNARTTGEGNTALMFAITHSSIGVIKYLVNQKADVNAVDKETKTTPLMLAADRNNSEIVQFLLLCGADATKKDSKGQLAEDRTNNAQIKKLIQSWQSQGDDEI